MSSVKRIILDRAEGPTEMCGIHYSYSYDAAEATLRHWGHTVRPRGYDKIDVTIEFDDGNSFQFRYDLRNCGTEGEHDDKGFYTNVKERLEYMAGLRCPSHMEQFKYNHLMELQEKRYHGRAKEIKQLLKTYFQ